jgi:putative transposase
MAPSADGVWHHQIKGELAIVEYVGWFNPDRLHEALGDLPSAEFEALSLSGSRAPSLSR